MFISFKVLYLGFKEPNSNYNLNSIRFINLNVNRFIRRLSLLKASYKSIRFYYIIGSNINNVVYKVRKIKRVNLFVARHIYLLYYPSFKLEKLAYKVIK